MLDQNETPLPEVSVTIQGTAFEATTDRDGRYSIGFAPGKLQVRYAKPGYTHFTRTFEVSTKTGLPAEDTYLFQLPEDGDRGLMAYDAHRSVELRPATLSLSRAKDPDYQGSHWFQKYLSTIWAEGDIAQFSADKIALLDPSESRNRILLRLLPDGALVRRKNNVEGSDDAYLKIEEDVYSQGGGYLRVPAEPLAPGIYASVLENQSMPGLSGLDDWSPSSISFATGSPVLHPAFLFEIVGGSDSKGTADHSGGFRSFTPLRDRHLALLSEVETARARGDWEEAVRLLLESRAMAPNAGEDEKSTDSEHAGGVQALTVIDLFKQASIDFASRENWEGLAAFVDAVKKIDEIKSHYRPIESAAKAEEYEAEHRRENSRHSVLPPSGSVASAWFARGDLFVNADMPEKARECWDRAVSLARPGMDVWGSSEEIRNMAWFLATAADSRYRDGERALELATLTESRIGDAGDHDVLRIKAAALAETGQYDLAHRTQARALTSLKYRENQSPKPDDKFTPGLDYAAGELARFTLFRKRLAFREGSNEFERAKASLLEKVGDSLPNEGRDLAGWWRFPYGVFRLTADGRYRQLASHNDLVDGMWRLRDNRIIEVTVSTVNGREVNQSTFDLTVWLATDHHLVYHGTDKEREKRIAGRAELAFANGLPDGDSLAGHWECVNFRTSMHNHDPDGEIDLTAAGAGRLRSIHYVREDLPLRWQLFGDILILNYPEDKHPDFHRILSLEGDRMEWLSTGASSGSKRAFQRTSPP